MSPSPTTPVDPSTRLPTLVVWSTFTLLASFGNFVVLLISFLVPRLRANPLLLHLHFVFIVSGLIGASLVLGGDATNPNPSSRTCLFSAAAVLSFATYEAAAALGLVAKVWANGMLVQYPHSPILRYVSSTPLLFALPYITALPLFFASIGIGLNNRASVYRGSTFYCTIQSSSITTISPIVTAVITLVTLMLAGWTATLVARSRWRATRSVRSLQVRNYRLVVRVLAFSVLVAIAFVCGLVSIAIGFSVDWNDIVVASLGVGAFLIFATDKDILSLLFLCRQAPPSSSQFTSVSTGIKFQGGLSGGPALNSEPGAKGMVDVTSFPPHPAVSFSGPMYAREEVMLTTFHKVELGDDDGEERTEEKAVRKGAHHDAV